MTTHEEHFLKCWPNEGVGYIKGGAFYPLENIADDPRNYFEVDPTFLLNEPECLLHSHCTGNGVDTTDPRSPSFQDLEEQIKTGIEWGIVVTDGVVCEEPLYWGNPDNRPPLLGRRFIFNLQDCFTLVQDWFYEERGVVLPNLPRQPLWNHEGENHIEEKYAEWGFSQVDRADLQRGDVLFYKVRSSVVNHLGIYLGNGEVLSHFYGQVSCVQPFTKWAAHIEFAARYLP